MRLATVMRKDKGVYPGDGVAPLKDSPRYQRFDAKLLRYFLRLDVTPLVTEGGSARDDLQIGET